VGPSLSHLIARAKLELLAVERRYLDHSPVRTASSGSEQISKRSRATAANGDSIVRCRFSKRWQSEAGWCGLDSIGRIRGVGERRERRGYNGKGSSIRKGRERQKDRRRQGQKREKTRTKEGEKNEREGGGEEGKRKEKRKEGRER